MTGFAESKINRDQEGKFADKPHMEAPSDIINDDEAENHSRTYDVYADRLPDVAASIKKANTRLAKNGIEGRFDYDVEEYTEVVKGVEVKRARITLARPRLGYDGYEFMARVEPLDNGEFIAYSAPGSEMEGWRPESMDCEHCGVKRHRSKVYVVKDRDGSYKTIGGSCLELYTGMSPSGLWALEYDDLDALEQEDANWGSSPRGERVVSSDQVLGLSYLVTEKEGYQNTYSDRPTATTIRDILNPPPKSSPGFVAWASEMKAQASQLDMKKIRDEVNTALEGETSDWATNVKATLKTEHINNRGIGTLASSMAAVHRARKKAAETPWAPGFVAPDGTKLKGIKAKVRYVEHTTEYYGYNEKVVVKITMQTEDGHKVFYKGSSTSAFEIEQGQDIVFGGTVKGNDTYKGVDSTRITRATFSAGA